MSDRRIDRIAKILEDKEGRLRLHDLLQELRQVEGSTDIPYGALHVAIQAENERLEQLGRRRRFRTARNGEERGWVSLESKSEFTPGSTAEALEVSILEANRRVDEQLRERLCSMDWRTFESTFLSQVLERLGFQNVQVTQPTRDGGTDARVCYKRGLIEANAIVSAKRWKSRNAVSVDEVRNLRGIRGDEDTAIIITTTRFTNDAKHEAKPSQNQRAVYLIDGDQLIEICKQYGIGVQRVSLPPLLVLDEEEFQSADESDETESPGTDEQRTNGIDVQRFRDEMLGDTRQGLSAEEIASLLGLRENSVKSYLSVPERRSMLGDRIRGDPALRAKALTIVSHRRSALAGAT